MLLIGSQEYFTIHTTIELISHLLESRNTVAQIILFVLNRMSAITNANIDLEKRVIFFTKLGTHLFICTAKEIRDISLKERPAEGLSGQWSKTIEIFCNVSGAGIGAGVGSIVSVGPGILTGARCGKMIAGILNNIVQSGISGILQVG